MFIDIKSIFNDETAPRNAKRAQTMVYTIVLAKQDTATIENAGINVNAVF